MKPEKLPIVSETLYAGGYWYGDIYRGLQERALAHGLEPVNYLIEAGESLPAELDGERPVILLGTSTAWFRRMTLQARQRALRMLLVGSEQKPGSHGESAIHLDFYSAMFDALGYLKGCGRPRVALAGINPASAADGEKAAYFREALQAFGLTEQPGAIFYNEGSLERNVCSFIREAGRFDAVICPNDFAALELLRRYPGYSPQALYVIGFGSTLLGRLISPSLTTITLRYRDVGRQAVDIWQLLRQNKTARAIDCGVACEILPRETTGFQPVGQPATLPRAQGPPAASENTFYCDSSVQRMQQLEVLLTHMDGMDCRILRGVLEGKPYEALAEALCISDGTVKYRLKRMVRCAGFSGREELFRQVNQLLSGEALERLEEMKR